MKDLASLKLVYLVPMQMKCKMKTAISIPNSIFEAAERFAQRLGVSRSQLYTTAVSEYLRKNRHEQITEKLNEVGCVIPNYDRNGLVFVFTESANRLISYNLNGELKNIAFIVKDNFLTSE